jgi:uncharacterized membrane protein YkvA (DUF1232 family)
MENSQRFLRYGKFGVKTLPLLWASHTCLNLSDLTRYICQREGSLMVKRALGKPATNWYRKLLRHSKYRWVVLMGTVMYLVSPLDISPDFMPFVGWIDDGLVATIAITEVTQMLVDRKRRLQTNATHDGNKNADLEVVDVNAVNIN